MRLFDSDRLVVGLMIEATRGIVIGGRVARSDVVGHVQASSDFVEEFAFELGISRRWLLGLHLGHLPTTGHRHQGSLFELDGLEWFGRISFPVGRRIGVKDPGKVGSSFSRCKNSKREATKLCKEWQCRHDVRNASRLSWSIGSKPMQHRICWDAFIVTAGRVEAIPGMIAQDVILDRVTRGIKNDPIHSDR